MPSEGSFAASGPRRHGEPPARRPRGVGARWHQGHFDSCPVFWGHLPGAFWFLPGSCRPRLGSSLPPGGGGAGVLFTRVPLKPPKPGQERALPSQDPRPLKANGWGFLPQGLCVPWLVACGVLFLIFPGERAGRQPSTFPRSTCGQAGGRMEGPPPMPLVPIRRWLGGSWSGTASGPSSLSTYFWICSSFNSQNLPGIIFLARHPSGRWVCARGRLALVGWSGGLASASTGDP